MVAPLTYDFHDGVLLAAAVGPRREVTLQVGLDRVWQPPDTATYACLRFGGIVNFDEASIFFARAEARPRPAHYAYFGRIDRLDYHPAEVSRVNRLVLLLELEWHGALVIRCRNVTMWEELDKE